MPKFHKEILPAGKHLVTLQDGRRVLREFTADYLKKVATTANQMMDLGLKIPAPFKHTKDAVPVETIPETNSFDNAGYLDPGTVEVTPNDDGVPTLCAVVDSPGDVKDLNTPAGKLMKRVKEISACIVDGWVDGANRTWGPSLLHAAPVINPVVPGQKEFQLLSLPTENCCMLGQSSLLAVGSGSADIGELSQALRESVNIYLDPGTPPEQVVQSLIVVLHQNKMSNETNLEDEEVVDTHSVYLSFPEGHKMPLTKSQAEEVIQMGALHPETKKPLTLNDFEVSADPPNPQNEIDQLRLELSQATQFAQLSVTALNETHKDRLRDRTATCIRNGQTTQEYADEKIFPQIDEYRLSLGEDKKVKPGGIDLLIESLEALPKKESAETNPQENFLSNFLPPGATQHSGNEGTAPDTEIPKEQMDQMTEEFLTAM